MINTKEVYKIRYVPLPGNVHYTTSEWITGVTSWSPKFGGSGKTFTSKNIVNRMFRELKKTTGYGKDFICEIITFSLRETNTSQEELI